jgi:hypothetical protein
MAVIRTGMTLETDAGPDGQVAQNRSMLSLTQEVEQIGLDLLAQTAGRGLMARTAFDGLVARGHGAGDTNPGRIHVGQREHTEHHKRKGRQQDVPSYRSQHYRDPVCPPNLRCYEARHGCPPGFG